jgi:hypothetical protein
MRILFQIECSINSLLNWIIYQDIHFW